MEFYGICSFDNQKISVRWRTAEGFSVACKQAEIRNSGLIKTKMENLMKKNVTNIESLTHYALNLLGLNDLLPRFAALMAIFAILIPTVFIIPAEKVSANQSAPIIISAPPEAFAVSSQQSAVSSQQSAVSR